MFKLRIRNLNETYGGGKGNLAADFLQAIGFLGTDGPRTRETKRAKTGIRLFTKCLIPRFSYPINKSRKCCKHPLEEFTNTIKCSLEICLILRITQPLQSTEYN